MVLYGPWVRSPTFPKLELPQVPASAMEKIIDGGDEAVLCEADLHMGQALVHHDVIRLLAGIDTPDGAAGAPGEKGGDLLGFPETPVRSICRP